jgi:hypothetical protein
LARVGTRVGVGVRVRAEHGGVEVRGTVVGVLQL